MTAATEGPGGKRLGAGRKPGANSLFQAAKARKETALAALREMEVAEKQRGLISVSEVEEVVGTAFAQVAQSLLSLPDTLERIAGATPEQTEDAEQVIHAAMDDLAIRLSTLQASAPVDRLAAMQWLLAAVAKLEDGASDDRE